MEHLPIDKRRSRGELTRMALLEAALFFFGERGYEGAGTRDIASKAGCNQGLIAFHFGGKEGLYNAALSIAFENLGTIIQPMTRRLREALAAGGGTASLRAVLEKEITATLLALMRKKTHQSWFLLLRRSLQSGDEKTKALYNDLFAPLHGVVCGIMKKNADTCQEDSSLRAFLLVDMMFSFLHDYPVFLSMTAPRDMEADARTMTVLLCRSLLAAS